MFLRHSAESTQLLARRNEIRSLNCLL